MAMQLIDLIDNSKSNLKFIITTHYALLFNVLYNNYNKFKDKKFAAGCSRDVITKGAGNLGWELPKLMEMTILAMRSCEDSVAEEMKKMGLAE